VKTHLLHQYEKLGVNDRAVAVAEAYNEGLLTPP
jgi:ATP/maltotriose-dependent transcriptional regulator MalT